MIIAFLCPQCSTRFTVPADEEYNDGIMTGLTFLATTGCPIDGVRPSLVEGLPEDIRQAVERLRP